MWYNGFVKIAMKNFMNLCHAQIKYHKIIYVYHCVPLYHIIVGYLYTGLMDGRVVKIDLQTESYTLVTRMGDSPYTNCG